MMKSDHDGTWMLIGISLIIIFILVFLSFSPRPFLSLGDSSSSSLNTTATIVTDVRDNAGQIEKKTQLLTFTNGLLTTQGAESNWTATADI